MKKIDYKSKKFIIPVSITAVVVIIAIVVGIIFGVNANKAKDIESFKIGYKLSDIQEDVEDKTEMSVGQAANLQTGDTLQLYAVVEPKDAISDDDVKWAVKTEDNNSSNTQTEVTSETSDAASTNKEAIVSVSEKGLVKAENEGMAVIEASVGVGNTKKLRQLL